MSQNTQPELVNLDQEILARKPIKRNPPSLETPNSAPATLLLLSWEEEGRGNGLRGGDATREYKDSIETAKGIHHCIPTEA